MPTHISPRTRATTHTLHSGVHRSLGALLRAGAFGLASSMHWLPFSRGVTCASGVLSCRAFLFVTRDGAGARRMFQGVGVDVSSARRLASLHAGFPVHVWRCRHPSPRGGWARCAERPPSRPWLPRVTGGRCYTRPCARAKGPSSFSAVRRQGWLNYPCLLYTSPSPRDQRGSRMPSSA